MAPSILPADGNNSETELSALAASLDSTPVITWLTQQRRLGTLDRTGLRRGVMMRMIWQVAYYTSTSLVANIDYLLGRSVWGSDVRTTLAADICAMRGALATAGHRLAYSGGPRKGYYVRGRPETGCAIGARDSRGNRQRRSCTLCQITRPYTSATFSDGCGSYGSSLSDTSCPVAADLSETQPGSSIAHCPPKRGGPMNNQPTMTKPYTPTDATIRTWVGDQSFSRGQRYHRQHAITNPRRQGDTLKANCFGSAPQPYRVEVTLGKDQIVGDHCSCPIGGQCKHVAALLLTWSEEPDSFTVIEELAAGLDRLSKADLIALVTKMVDRHPDLEQLLELSVLNAGAESQPLDPALVDRQVNAVFNHSDYEYGSEVAVAEQLADIRELGDGYAEKGEWRNAALVYKTVIEGVLENYEMFHDEGGELGEVVNECVSGLEPCLANAQDPALRELILRTLFDTYHWDVDFGGIDMGYEAADLILAFATPAEKRKVIEWVQSVMPAGDSWSDNYHRQRYGHFLLRLQEDELEDETFLRICRESGRIVDLVDRLLALQRIEEAIQAVQAASDYELLSLEPIFSKHDQFDLFARLVAGRAPATTDTRIKGWLRKYAEKQGNFDQALTLAQELFWLQPNMESYGEVQRFAAQEARWPALQREIIDRLRQEPRHHDLLTYIYLQEGEIDQALEMLHQKAARPGWRGGYLVSTVALDVARAAEETRPQAAIEIYKKEVERLINERNRGSYAEAADRLAAVRDLYRKVGEEDRWRQLIADLRQQHRTLRALQDELNKARL